MTTRSRSVHDWLPQLMIPALTGLALMTAALYLGYARWLTGTTGFPLDDAWIHQTFARSLAWGWGLVFNPGEPIAGTTAPLWTALLIPGQLGWIEFRLWTYLLGLLALIATAALGGRLTAELTGRRGPASLATLAVMLDWRLAWAALSGMETILFAALSLVAITEGLRPRGRPWLAGLAAGLAVLTRPEALALVALLVGLKVPSPMSKAQRPGARPWILDYGLGTFLVPVGALVCLALGLNWSLNGQPLPSTFYAKSDFYGGIGSLAGAGRYLLGVLTTLFFSPLLVLVPGLVGAVWRGRVRARETNGRLLLALATWAILLPLIYLARLPVLYQHGRYLMPVIPAIVVIACWGGEWLWRRLPLRRLARVYLFAAAAFYTVLWLNGAQVYSWNVKYIQDEQVQVAHWLRDRTSPDALVATHDIGAIGYFAGRRVIDLAGLVTPSLAGHLRDEAYLWEYLRANRADYLAVLPDWYPNLSRQPGLELVFTVEAPYVSQAGGTNFQILRLPWGD